MTAILILIALIAIAALAPRFGRDSRDLRSGHSDSFPALPDHERDWVVSHEQVTAEARVPAQQR